MTNKTIKESFFLKNLQIFEKSFRIVICFIKRLKKKFSKKVQNLCYAITQTNYDLMYFREVNSVFMALIEIVDIS